AFAPLAALSRIPRAQKTPMTSISPLVQLVWCHSRVTRTLAIVYCGAIAQEAQEAHAALLDDIPGAGLLAMTSPDRLHADWLHHQHRGSINSHIERLLAPLSSDALLVTILDG